MAKYTPFMTHLVKIAAGAAIGFLCVSFASAQSENLPQGSLPMLPNAPDRFLPTVQRQTAATPSGTEPKIDRALPSSGPVGQYVTIEGERFGSSIASVVFVSGAEGVEADKTFPDECKGLTWHDRSIVVKVPQGLADGAHTVKVKRLDGSTSNGVRFVVNQGYPTPGICALSPNNGPPGISVKIIGSRFGTSFGSAVMGSVDMAVEESGWSDSMVRVQTSLIESLSGKIRIISSDKTLSNPVAFTFQRCSPGSCGAGNACCADGSCRPDGRCEDRPPQCTYSWSFYTGELGGLGAPCQSDAQCLSGVCVGGKCAPGQKGEGARCTFDAECMAGLKCENGICRSLLKKNGDRCVSDKECFSGKCEKGACVNGDKKIGEQCKYNQECASGNCYNGKCAQALVCPKVLKTEPPPTATYPQSIFSILFNQIMDETSLRSSLSFTPKTDGAMSIKTSGSGAESKSLAEFRPSKPLKSGVKYLFSVAPTVKSASSDSTLARCTIVGGNSCVGKGSVCDTKGSLCEGGAVCSGSSSICRGVGTICTGKGSKCLEGATCKGTGSTCLDKGSSCTNDGSVCRVQALCSGKDAQCAQSGTICTGDGSICKDGAQCKGKPPVVKEETCSNAGQTCSAQGAVCNGGAQCNGIISRCSEKDTLCAGNGSSCTNSSTCDGSNSICSGVGTLCTGSESKCINGARCTGVDPVCDGKGSECIGDNPLCTNGAICNNTPKDIDCGVNDSCPAGYICIKATNKCIRPPVCGPKGECPDGMKCDSATNSCRPVCGAGGICPGGLVCNPSSNICVEPSSCDRDGKCPNGLKCSKENNKCYAPCGPGGSCPAGLTCNAASQTCEPPRECINGTCPNGEVCSKLDNRCYPACGANGSCPGGLVCNPATNGCEPPVPCGPGGACPAGAVCNAETKMCDPVVYCNALGKCPSGLECDAASGTCKKPSNDSGPIACNPDGSCPAGYKKDPAALPDCQCLPDCSAGQKCPAGSTCDASSGVCRATCPPDTNCRPTERCIENMCKPIPSGPRCGDDTIQLDRGEECDNGTANGAASSFCTASCTLVACGPKGECPGGSKCSADGKCHPICPPCESPLVCDDAEKVCKKPIITVCKEKKSCLLTDDCKLCEPLCTAAPRCKPPTPAPDCVAKNLFSCQKPDGTIFCDKPCPTSSPDGPSQGVCSDSAQCSLTDDCKLCPKCATAPRCSTPPPDCKAKGQYECQRTDGTKFCSDAVCEVVVTPPDSVNTIHAPTNLKAEKKGTAQIDLSWQDNSTSERGFLIYRSKDDDEHFQPVAYAPANQQTFSNLSLESNTTYYYKVSAFNESAFSLFSNSAFAKTDLFGCLLFCSTPQIPQNVRLSSNGAVAQLSWEHNGENITAFVIERTSDTGETKTYIQRYSVTAAERRFDDNDVIAGVVYWYRMYAVNGNKKSATTEAKSVVINGSISKPKPGKPDLTAVANGAEQIKLTWSNVENETGYKVYRTSNEPGFFYLTTLGRDVFQHIDTGLQWNTSYTYIVIAVNDSSGETASDKKTAKTNFIGCLLFCATPQAPSSIVATVKDATLQLSWVHDGKDVTTFRIERASNSESEKIYDWKYTVGKDERNFTDTQVLAGTTYWYRIFALNDAKESLPSAVVFATVPKSSTNNPPNGPICAPTLRIGLLGYYNNTHPTFDWLINNHLGIIGAIDTESDANTLLSRDYDIYMVDAAWWGANGYNDLLEKLWLNGKNVISVGNDSTQGLYPINRIGWNNVNPFDLTSKTIAGHPVVHDFHPLSDIGKTTDSGASFIYQMKPEFTPLYARKEDETNIMGIIGERDGSGVWFHDNTSALSSSSQGRSILLSVIDYMTRNNAKRSGSTERLDDSLRKAPDPACVPLCNNNGVCDSNEGCNCRDCDEQRDSCTAPALCSFSQKKCAMSSSTQPGGGNPPCIPQIIPGKGLRGQYFATEHKDPPSQIPQGSVLIDRIDPTINFDWSRVPNDPSVPPGWFLVRWTGGIRVPTSGTYQFHTASDDGIVVAIDNKTIISNWTPHGTSSDRASMTLEKDKLYPITITYYENHGYGWMQLFWSASGLAEQIVPTEYLYPSSTDGISTCVSASSGIAYLDSFSVLVDGSDRTNSLTDSFSCVSGKSCPAGATATHTYSVKMYGKDSAGVIKEITTPSVSWAFPQGVSSIVSMAPSPGTVSSSRLITALTDGTQVVHIAVQDVDEKGFIKRLEKDLVVTVTSSGGPGGGGGGPGGGGPVNNGSLSIDSIKILIDGIDSGVVSTIIEPNKEDGSDNFYCSSVLGKCPDGQSTKHLYSIEVYGKDASGVVSQINPDSVEWNVSGGMANAFAKTAVSIKDGNGVDIVDATQQMIESVGSFVGPTAILTAIVTIGTGSSLQSISASVALTFCSHPWSYNGTGEDIKLFYCRDTANAILPRLASTPHVRGSGLQSSIFTKEFIFPFVKDGTGNVQDPNYTDVIIVRSAPNPDRLPLAQWYKKYVPLGAMAEHPSIDGFPALQDGSGIYVFAPNLTNSNPNILFLATNTGMLDAVTTQVFDRLLSWLQLSSVRVGSNNGDALRRDIVRYMRFYEMKKSIEQFGRSSARSCAHNPLELCPYPDLASGSYIQRQTVSLWPSWRQSLSTILGTALPLDPLQEQSVPEVQCGAPYDNDTCWSEEDKRFGFGTANNVEDALFKGKHVFTYTALDNGKDYRLCAAFEYQSVTKNLFGLLSGWRASEDGSQSIYCTTKDPSFSLIDRGRQLINKLALYISYPFRQ